MRDIFENESEKERASKIADQLKGMTIREAQELLSKISEALVNSITF
jgi:ribosomal protein L22